MKRAFSIGVTLTALTAFVLGCSALMRDGNDELYEPAGGNSASGWYLEARSHEDAKAEIVGWAEKMFASGNQVTFGDVPAGATVVEPVKLVRAFEIEAVEIPASRFIDKNVDVPVQPESLQAFVLKDATDRTFVSFGTLYPGGRVNMFAFSEAKATNVTTVDVNGQPLPSSAIATDDWPAPRYLRAMESGAKLLYVPYPRAMDQVFLQVGTDSETSELISTSNGRTYTGVNGYLDAVDAQIGGSPQQ